MSRVTIVLSIVLVACAVSAMWIRGSADERPSTSSTRSAHTPSTDGEERVAQSSKTHHGDDKQTPHDQDAWRPASAGYEFSFPRDHAAHEDYRIEWWYYTGNLDTADGRRFGYELTFFRTGIHRTPASTSRWAVRDLYITHFAISDTSAKKFHQFERLNRRGIGWAGAKTDSYHVWNEGWEARLEGARHVLRADSDQYALELELESIKPPAVHGEEGLSRKGSAPGNASHYYSITRMQTKGTLTLEGKSYAVSGLSWMDHEFSTSFLQEGQQGWDWFSIQLDDGSELMLYRMRREDGTADPFSSGSLVDKTGGVQMIRSADFVLKPGETWRSSISGGVYPIEWTVDVSRVDLQLTVRAVFPEQEMMTSKSAGIIYYEGCVDVTGTASGRPVRGRGYLEMTGYAGKPAHGRQ